MREFPRVAGAHPLVRMSIEAGLRIRIPWHVVQYTTGGRVTVRLRRQGQGVSIWILVLGEKVWIYGFGRREQRSNMGEIHASAGHCSLLSLLRRGGVIVAEAQGTHGDVTDCCWNLDCSLGCLVLCRTPLYIHSVYMEDRRGSARLDRHYIDNCLANHCRPQEFGLGCCDLRVPSRSLRQPRM